MIANNPLVVDINTQLEFTEENLQTYKDVRPVKGHPHIFCDRPNLNIKYRGDEPILAYYDQLKNYNGAHNIVRRTQNPKITSIHSDIDKNGYSLAEIGGSVLINLENGDMYLIDAVTRSSKLKASFVSNIPCEVFEVDCIRDGDHLEEILLELGTDLNNYKKDFGDCDVYDMSDSISKLVEIATRRNPTHLNEEMVGDYADKYITKLDKGGKLTNAQVNTIINNCKEELLEGKTGALPFIKGVGTSEWLTDNGYNGADKSVIYIATAASTPMKLMGKIADIVENSEQYEDTDTIRFITYLGTLDGKNPFKDWVTTNREFLEKFQSQKERFDDHRGFYTMEGTERVPYKRNTEHRIQYEIYGAIPQVYAYDEKYPMGKIVKFKGNRDLNPNKVSIII